MTIALIRWFALIFLACFLLTGCGSIPIFSPPPKTLETEHFAQGIDQYIASGDLTILKQISEKSPQKEWRTRAEAIIAMDNKQKQQREQTKKAEEDLSQCQLEKNHLLEDNQILEKTLTRLKDLLIDTERRAE